MERMMEMRELRRDLARYVHSLGFDSGDRMEALMRSESTAYWRLVRTALCMGLYMNVVQVRRPLWIAQTESACGNRGISRAAGHRHPDTSGGLWRRGTGVYTAIQHPPNCCGCER